MWAFVLCSTPLYELQIKSDALSGQLEYIRDPAFRYGVTNWIDIHACNVNAVIKHAFIYLFCFFGSVCITLLFYIYSFSPIFLHRSYSLRFDVIGIEVVFFLFTMETCLYIGDIHFENLAWSQIMSTSLYITGNPVYIIFFSLDADNIICQRA